MSEDDDRRRLSELSARLLRLHGVLLERERAAYESTYGRVAPREMLRLLLGDERFAWLRALSQLVARIDDAVDSRDMPDITTAAEALVRETAALVRAGGRDEFGAKYAAALQESADVVMAHAAVVKMLDERRG